MFGAVQVFVFLLIFVAQFEFYGTPSAHKILAIPRAGIKTSYA